ncbi:hypothetical protein [Streptomyces sp. NPDC093544]|uniref:hypothetical protein n=1 Tax=Streptomyces sp. NPDC093544 TaxID=3155200 RepID=UPI00342E69D9
MAVSTAGPELSALQNAILCMVALLGALLPFQPRRRVRHSTSDPHDVAQPVRTPDPYVGPVPNPRVEAWLPSEPWQRGSDDDDAADDDPVRPYVREAMGEEWSPGGWRPRHE